MTSENNPVTLEPQMMEELEKTVRDFVRKEYDEELVDAAFDDLSCIGIAETNAEDREDIVIDVVVNAKDLTLDQYVNGDKLDSWHYDSLESLLGEVRTISFDELVSLGPKSEERVEQLKTQFPMEHDFLRNPEDSYALYQVKSGPEYHELRFSSMDDLKSEAKRFRHELHEAAEKLEDMLIESKPHMESLLTDMGLTVVPNDDTHRITLQNAYGMKGDICLGYGVNYCWPEGCDTRALDEPVRHENYSMVYSGPLEMTGEPEQILNDLYRKFNLDHPPFFMGHSMSVSDVVVLMQNGQATAYFCDNIGFEKLPDFLADQPLRNVEMAVEDDYDMIDGIINNGTKEDKPSLREQLSDIRSEIGKQDRPHPEKSSRNDMEH